jgi:uncharacterized protein with PIN domain
MIVIDSSALIAILQNEPERSQFASTIARASRKLLSTVSHPKPPWSSTAAAAKPG